MTKIELSKKIENIAKIKLTNYRLTSNDLMYMVDFVYDEIVTRANIAFIKQDVIIDSNVEWYDLNALYVPVGNEKPMNTVSVVNDNGYSISKFFKEKGSNVFRLKDGDCDLPVCHDNICIEDGDTVTFNRHSIPDIELLDESLQIALVDTIMQGMMYHFHDSIPDPTSSNSTGQETNLHYQRYYNSIMGIKNMYPQTI